MRRSVLLPVVAALFAMLLGMASPALAREGATPVVPTPSPTATSKNTDSTADTSDLTAKQPEVRMTKDGSRPLTLDEIAHDDELWAPVIARFENVEGWFAFDCSSNSPMQSFIAQQIANGSDVEGAWTSAYEQDVAGLFGNWNSFYNFKPQYVAALSDSIGEPPFWWSSDLFPYPWDFAIHMDEQFPGCSTGASQRKA